METVMKRLSGKVAVVTGGASGIGAATCRRLVEEGAQVAIGDLDAERAHALAQELGDAALGVPFDAGDIDSVRNLIEATVGRFGRLDILHNNAAIMSNDFIRQDSNPVDIDFEVWDRTFRVNVRGYLAGCKFAIPHMLKLGGGAIIMTASGSGHRGDLANIAYGSSKAAVIGFARYVATIYGKQGIRCNTISPGLIRTEGGQKNVQGEMVNVMARNTLTPRLGLPADIAAAVAFLASDDGAFVTGQDLSVDGGMLAHMPYYSDFMNTSVAW
jgi:NAD(P)-dependent dehydrogenase (short-subunit alcohol dehydrogenase family)